MKTYIYFNEFNGNYYLQEVSEDKGRYEGDKDLFAIPIDKNLWESSELSKDFTKINPLPKFLIEVFKSNLTLAVKESSNQELNDLRTSKFSKARLEHAKLTNDTKLLEEYKTVVKELIDHEDEMLEHLDTLRTLPEFFEFNRALRPGWNYWWNTNKTHGHISKANKSFSTNSTLNLSKSSFNLSAIMSSDSEEEVNNESIRKRNSANKKV